MQRKRPHATSQNEVGKGDDTHGSGHRRMSAPVLAVCYPCSRQAPCPTGLLAAGIGGPRWPANANFSFQNGCAVFVPTA